MPARDDGFRAFVEDQLADLPGLTCRPMFGGFGLYAGKIFFGIIAAGQLYFKTDDATRQPYLARGMTPFQPTKEQTLRTYYALPAEILEDPDALREWAEAAIHCTRAPRPRQPAKHRRATS